jgi:hypothetical protein
VPDGRVTRQGSQDPVVEVFRDQAHTPVGSSHAFPVDYYYPGALLAPVLKSIEPEIGEPRCIGQA